MTTSDVGSLDLASLSAVLLDHGPGWPAGFRHLQVRMPAHPAVDAIAPAVVMVDDPVNLEPLQSAATEAAVRHWCGEDVGQLTVQCASTRQMRTAASPALTMDAVLTHDDRLLEHAGCPLVRVSDDQVLPWVPATRHHASGLVPGWAPYSQSVVRYLDGWPKHPIAHPMNMAGIAASRRHADVVERACADIVAQDVLMSWWVGDNVVIRPVAAPTGAGGADVRLVNYQLNKPGLPPVQLVVADDATRGPDPGSWTR